MIGAAWETVNEKRHKEDKGLAGSSTIQRAHIDVKPSIFKFRGILPLEEENYKATN
ncbi:hypothetical protein YC2023_045034 [Brassica napus]